MAPTSPPEPGGHGGGHLPVTCESLAEEGETDCETGESSVHNSQTLEDPASPTSNGKVNHACDDTVIQLVDISPDTDSAAMFLDDAPEVSPTSAKQTTSTKRHFANDMTSQRSHINSFGEGEARGSRWSITHLRKSFLDVKIEELYCRYWLRLQRVLLFKLLLVVIGYGLILLTLYNTLGKQEQKHEDDQKGSQIWINGFLASSLFLAIVVAILVYMRHVFMRLSGLLAGLVVVFLLVLSYAFLPFPYVNISPMDSVPMTFYVIFVLHTTLPARRRVCSFLGLCAGVLDLLLVGFLYNGYGKFFWDLKFRPLCANAVIYLCANLVGLYHKHLTDLAHRHTFLESRHFIEADIRFSRQIVKQTGLKEGLLLKVIPRHLLDDMKKVLNRKLEVDIGPKRVFHELMVDRHDDVRAMLNGNYFNPHKKRKLSPTSSCDHRFSVLVLECSKGTSILYADIVNFTPLTAQLEPEDLVLALNQLFGRFDELAKANNCVRIKILGDCYYCVSGLPDAIPDHARNCVLMGMQMIKVIRHIRKESGVDNLDMRIGIHTGYVLSGVLGLQKWQYDVWSDDVTIANHMEAGGCPGKVHITESTLRELGDEFEVEPGDGASRDQCLADQRITTYFIAEHELKRVDIQEMLHADHLRRSVRRPRRSKAIRRRVSMATYMECWGAETPFDSLSDYMMEKTMPEVTEVNKRLERGFNLEWKAEIKDDGWKKASLFGLKFRGRKVARLGKDPWASSPIRSHWMSSQRLSRHNEEIRRLTMRFKDGQLESRYVNQRDPAFKFYVLCAFVIFNFVVAIQFIILPSTWTMAVTLAVGWTVFTTLLILTTGLKCLPGFTRFPGSCQKGLGRVSAVLTSNVWCKATLSLLPPAVIFLSSVLPVVNCYWVTHDGSLANLSSHLTDNSTTELTDEARCLFAPYYVCSCMLALAACSVFLQISYILKTLYMVLGLIIFNSMFHLVFSRIFEFYDYFTQADFLSSSVRASLYTGIMFITLIVLDRQIEFNQRLDFLCQTKIQRDKEEVKRNELLNELLLNNILPRHVAEYFMRPHRPKHEIYHQLHPNVCVMFAGIPNFKTFFSSIDVSGKECLRLLNEIISAFDKMLILRQYDGVEKIKTIGSTYMAAAGLTDDQQDADRLAKNVVVMTRFAFAMQSKLTQISQDAFGDYKLRVGMCHGKVIAGVVGASKPQYDIWGDTVNVASRMETNGQENAIQVPEKTAELLESHGIPCVFREERVVKGKGLMKLFLVDHQRAVKRMTSGASHESAGVDILCNL